MWSLGCVIYHMMMLRPPFDGTNPLSVASKIVEGSYDEVRTHTQAFCPACGPQSMLCSKYSLDVLLPCSTCCKA